jgi:hypothetical protein
MSVVVGGYTGAPAACAFARGLTCALGVGRDGPPYLGVERAGARTQGVGRGENYTLGSDEPAVTPLDRLDESIVDDH